MTRAVAGQAGAVAAERRGSIHPARAVLGRSGGGEIDIPWAKQEYAEKSRR